jgi:molybdopterin synthase catalytic subunit
VRIQDDVIDTSAEAGRTAALGGNIGALVTFTGLCRDEGGRLTALDLQHYPGMAEAEIERIVRDAATRWPLAAATVIHRHGRIIPGETIVFVATASTHRQAAFLAAEFIMDFLKTEAPFWKKEHGAAAGDWVGARDADDAAAGRWSDTTAGPRRRG